MSTPRDCRRRIHELALLCGFAVALAGCGSQVTISLTIAPDLPIAPPNLKLDVIEKGKASGKDFGPFAIGSIPDGQFVDVPPGTVFYIDAIGCANATKDSCPDNKPDSFIARGCSHFTTLTKDDGQSIPLVLHGIVEGAKTCPPTS